LYWSPHNVMIVQSRRWRG